MRFGGGHLGPDEGFGNVLNIHASVVQDRGLEMSVLYWIAIQSRRSGSLSKIPGSGSDRDPFA